MSYALSSITFSSFETSRKPHGRLLLVFLIVLMILLQGCGSQRRITQGENGEDNEGIFNNEISKFGAAATTETGLETIELDRILDPQYKARERWLAANNSKNFVDWKKESTASRYDLAFDAFDSSYERTDRTIRRNAAQARLLIASDRRCGRYTQYLKKKQADRNFWLGITSTAFATMGALIPGLRGAQNLAGASAFTGATRSEYNQDYFANLTASVITRGIEDKRKEALVAIGKRRGDSYEQYPIQVAIDDAVRYDSMCNVVAGLEKANDALQEQGREPGLDQIGRTLVKAQMVRHVSEQNFTKLGEDLEKLEKAGFNTKSLRENFISPASTNSGLSGLETYITAKDYALNPTHLTTSTREELLRSLKIHSVKLTDLYADPSVPSISASTMISSLTAVISQLGAQTTTSFVGNFSNLCFQEAKRLGLAASTATYAVDEFRASHNLNALTAAERSEFAKHQYANTQAQEDISRFASRLKTYHNALDMALSVFIASGKGALDTVRKSGKPVQDQAYLQALNQALTDTKDSPDSSVVTSSIPADARCKP